MGANDGDDKRSDLDKWFDSQRAELRKFEDQIFGRQQDNDTSTPNPSSRSPFERFKTFVDANFNTFTEGFKNFPSNVSELKARMQAEREARREEEIDIWRRWTASEDSPDYIRMQVDRASPEERERFKDATHMLLRQSYLRTRHIPAHKILALYRDNEWSLGPLDQFAAPLLSFGGACYYKAETLDNLPSTARWGWPQPKPQWLSVDWFKRSPYSPLRLEAHPELCTAGSNWRAAFEDLISATLDQPMRSENKVGLRPPFGKWQSTFYGPGLDWMLSLQCRGILPPQLPAMYKLGGPWDGRNANEWSVLTNASIEGALKDAGLAREYPQIRDDFNVLVDEVSIKSGPSTAASPLAVQAPQIEQTTWRVPETEAELYDNMFVYPSRQKPVFSGNHQNDRNNAVSSLFNALQDDDLDEASTLLIAYHRTYGAVGDITRVINYQLGPLLSQALSRTDIPVQAWWKWTEKEQSQRDATDKFRRDLVKDNREEANRVRESWGPSVGGELMNPEHGVPAMTGVEEVDYETAETALWDALYVGNTTVAAKCIDAFDKAYGCVGGIADHIIRMAKNPGWGSPMTSMLEEALDEALEKSRLPRNYDPEVHGRRDEEGGEYYERLLEKDQRVEDEERDDWHEVPEEKIQALTDVQMQSMLLEQQNRKRLEMAGRRQEEENARKEAGEVKPVVQNVVQRPDVLSQLTTTQTTRMPDGTVTTKVVLKQRFADGREETKESVTIENERRSQVDPEVSQEKTKGKGWFWN